jgi:uncharacterized protein with HEPN domain
MKGDSYLVRLGHMVEAIDHIRAATAGMDIDTFEANPIVRAAVERFIEIISEASRRLPDDLKSRHKDIPWKQVAGIGNVLRHDYEDVAPAVLWVVVIKNLAPLEKVCKAELQREQAKDINHPGSSI